MRNFINEKLDKLLLDCYIDEAIKNKKVLNEAMLPARSDIIKFSKTKRGVFTISVLSLSAISKLSKAIYNIYLSVRIPKCSKIINSMARKQCILQSKISSYQDTIQRLKSIRNNDNKEKINLKINDIDQRIKKLKKKIINTGLTF